MPHCTCLCLSKLLAVQQLWNFRVFEIVTVTSVLCSPAGGEGTQVVLRGRHPDSPKGLYASCCLHKRDSEAKAQKMNCS